MGDLDETLFGRPDKWRIFVSSKMHGNPLAAERLAAVEAIESLPMATAWYWERDARAGPYCAEGVCMGVAQTCDGLVLILAEELTRITGNEYHAARRSGAPRFIMLKVVGGRDAHTDRFIRREQRRVITKPFTNIAELKTNVKDAVVYFAVQAGRREIARGRERRIVGVYRKLIELLPIH